MDNKNCVVNESCAASRINNSQTVSKLSYKEKIVCALQNVTVEPTIILNGIATAMQDYVIQDFVGQQTCLMTYNRSREFCANITDSNVKSELNTQIANYNFYRSLLDTLPCVFIAMFFGPWSDKYGPKLLVLIPLIGDMLSSITYSVLAVITHVKPQYILLASIFQGLTGGNLIFNLGACCFIIQDSSIKSRTTRIAFADISFFIGIPIGRQIAVAIYSNFGLAAVFGTATQLNILAIAYALWRLRGVHDLNREHTSKVKALQDVFDLKNLMKCLRVVFKKREGSKRLHIILILISVQFIAFPRRGEKGIFYPFTRETLRFTLKDVSFYDLLSYGTLLIGNVIILPILSFYFRVKDIILVIAALLASIVNDLLIAFSSSALMIYIAATVILFSAPASAISKSLITKCVDHDELAKLLTVVMLIALGMPILSGLVYTEVFKATIAVFPGISYIMSASLTLIPIFCLAFVFYDIRQPTQTSPTDIEMNCLPTNDVKESDGNLKEMITKSAGQDK